MKRILPLPAQPTPHTVDAGRLAFVKLTYLVDYGI